MSASRTTPTREPTFEPTFEPGLEQRYEIKFCAPEQARHRIRRHLSLLPGSLRTQYPPRIVQSLYLDTPARSAFTATRDGDTERTKLRLRWYGDAEAEVPAFLERKRRAAGLVHKQRLTLPRPVAVAGRNADELMADLRALCPELALGDLRPSQWIRYRRDYLVDAQQRVRVTLDTELAFEDQSIRRIVEHRAAPTSRPRLLILEVKYARDDDDRGRRLCAALPLRRTRCSKYALACDPAGSGPLVDWLSA